MTQFKIENDRVAGLCGSCVHRETQITTTGTIMIRCAANGGRLVPEPLSFCSDYRSEDVFGKPFPEWMKTLAWFPVEAKNGSKQRRTFIPPNTASPDVQQQIGFGAKWARVREKRKWARQHTDEA